MTIEEMKIQKRNKGYTYAMLAKLSGVPIATIQKVFSGATVSPRYDTIHALEQVFNDYDVDLEPCDKQETTSEFKYDTKQEASAADDMVCEAAPAYQVKLQGDYTIDDYLALPEDQHVELIDGFFYDMAAPTTFHQLIASEICLQALSFIRKKDGSCIPFVAPVDVQLDCDDKTMLQPDVGILCDGSKLKRSRIYGAPDFIAEVISPSTGARDYGLKMVKYKDAGVREYWIIDVYKKRILAYDFEGLISPTIYGLDADVPVAIYHGELTINISGLLPLIERLMNEDD